MDEYLEPFTADEPGRFIESMNKVMHIPKPKDTLQDPEEFAEFFYVSYGFNIFWVPFKCQMNLRKRLNAL